MSNSKLKTQNLKLIALVVVFLALATLYSVVVPLGEGPDEPGHAGYAFFLARAGRLPVQRFDPRQTDVAGEGHQPPLAYALAAPLALWLAPEARQIEMIGNPRYTWAGGAEVNAVSHGSREYWPWQGAVLAWHLMRLVSVVFGAATVVFTYLAARELDFGLLDPQSKIKNLKSKMPLLAAGLVAFNPQFLFVSALVTNDALLVTLSAALLWLVVREPQNRRTAEPRTAEPRTENREPRTESRSIAEPEDRGSRIKGWIEGLWDVIAIGIVLGLALLTKQSAVILAPAAVLAVIVRCAGEQRPWRIWLRHPLTRSPVHLFSLLRAALVIGVAALVSGWWYLRNQRLYGDLLGLAAFRGEFATQPFQIASPIAWAAALAQLHASFWARFGWMNVAPPGWVIWLIGAIELAAVGGWIWRPQRGRPTGIWLLLVLPALAFAWVVSFAVTAGLVAWQGRLLFPALPAIAILLACGLSVVSRPLSVVVARYIVPQRITNRGPRAAVLFFVLCPLFLIALWLPGAVIRPAYPPQSLPEAAALAQIETPVHGQLRRRGEPGVDLRGWRLDGQPRPGAALDVSLVWFAAARQAPDWVVFVHLVDAQGHMVAEDNRPPRDGAFPTTQWNQGDWVEDRHRLALPADLATGAYTLRAGMYDPGHENQRAGVYDAEGDLIGEWLDLGRIIVSGD
jgi:4-amino-4-deoxy-L-arabinose transferase-like glycosyltransferase